MKKHSNHAIVTTQLLIITKNHENIIIITEIFQETSIFQSTGAGVLGVQHHRTFQGRPGAHRTAGTAGTAGSRHGVFGELARDVTGSEANGHLVAAELLTFVIHGGCLYLRSGGCA